MSLRKSLITYLIALLAVPGLAAPALAAPAAHAATVSAQAPDVACLEPFYDDKEHLGPKYLPDPPDTVGKMLVGYKRFGKLDADEFLKRHWKNGRWKYPDNDGFQGDPHLEYLPVGKLIDRFGAESGRFLAPADTPFAGRSLPPQSLNSCFYPDGFRDNSYYRYVVKREFRVLGGTTAAAFEQPGGGVQYKVETPPGNEETVNVAWLVRYGYLDRLKRD